MSEEEILKECTELAENEHHELGNCWDEEYSSNAIFGLIMLYKQTKKSEEVLANKLQEVNYDGHLVCTYITTNDNQEQPAYVTMQELQVINEKCKELGGIE